MKNVTHAMKDMNITNSLKSFVFELDENLTSNTFAGLGEAQNISLATEKEFSSAY